MSTDIARRGDTDSWADVLGDIGDLAAKIAKTSFVPADYQGKPAEIASCILTGRELGLGPMASLQGIVSIKGKPTLSAQLMRQLALRAGHDIAVEKSTDKVASVKGKRAGSDTWTTVTFSIEDATRAGINRGDAWSKYPADMLMNRATSRLCRLIFADALGGVAYTPDELSDDKPTTTRVSVAKPLAVVEDVTDAEIVEDQA